MGMAPIDAAGVGQPLRIDQNGNAFQQRIREGANLDIPKSGLERPRNDNRDRPPPGTGLSQDDASRDRGTAWQTRVLNVWDRYSNGDRQQQQTPSGTVVIDQGLKKAEPGSDPLVASPRLPDEDTVAWKKWKEAHVGAAQSEEYASDQLGPFMKTPRDAKRRRYTILNAR